MIHSYSTSSLSSESKKAEAGQNQNMIDKPLMIHVTRIQDHQRFLVSAKEEFGRGDSFIFCDETWRNRDYSYQADGDNEYEENTNTLIELIKRERYRNVKVDSSYSYTFHLETFLKKLIAIPHVTSLSLFDIETLSPSVLAIAPILTQGMLKEISLSERGLRAYSYLRREEEERKKEDFLIGLLKNKSVMKLSIIDYQWTKKVAEAIAENTTLSELFVGWYGLEVNSTEQLIKGLAKNKSIMTFSIGGYFGVESAKLLASNPTLTNLDVDGCGLDETSLIALSKISNIQRLNLGQNRNITLPVVVALASCPSLTHLGYASDETKGDGLAALMKSKSIRSLKLGSANLGIRGAEALAQNNSLTFLELSLPTLNDRALVFLVDQSKSVKQLHIRTNQIQSPRLTQALAANRALTQLYLYVSKRPFSEEQLLDLALSQNIQSLSLMGPDQMSLKRPDQVSEITEKVAKALAQNRVLTEIDLSQFTAGEKAMIALVESQTITELRTDGIKLTKAVAKALAENKVLTRLTLPDHDLGEDVVEVLAKNKNIVDLRIQDTSYSVLEKAPVKVPQLVETMLSKNIIALHNWKRVALLLVSYRANQDSLIKDSILTLLTVGEPDHFLQEEYSISCRFFKASQMPKVESGDRFKQENASVLRA